MSQRLPLDRITHLARSGLGVGKELARKGLHLAAGGVSRAVEAAQRRRESGPEPGAGSAAASAPEPAPRSEGKPARGTKPAPKELPEEAIPTPAEVAKVVEAKPAAQRKTGTKQRSKPAKKAAPGAKLPPRPREPVPDSEPEKEPVAKKASRTS